MGTRMQQRRATAAEWAAVNPVLAEGELGYEIDTKNFKIGDGTTVWNSLIYGHISPGVFDVKGDLIVGTGSDTFARLSAGTNGAILISDSTAPDGVRWTVDGKVGTDGTGDYIVQIRRGTSTIQHSGGNRYINTDIPLVDGDILQIHYHDVYGNAVQLQWWSYAVETVYVGNDATPARGNNGLDVGDGTMVHWTILRAT